jgi:hypothetical protein
MTPAEREAIGLRCVELAVALTRHEAQMPLPITVAADLTVEVAGSKVQLTPSQGLGFAEQLARASFRRALTEEALVVAPDLDTRDAARS